MSGERRAPMCDLGLDHLEMDAGLSSLMSAPLHWDLIISAFDGPLPMRGATH